ncbi:sialidase family protein [Mangrovibacterium lignilyticum]|uniref:sialidase family protein n=1 Tax=Mangrovibacterium lignilyticum TaxID=2668052 RepID=UPI0013D6B33A|nr:sialidase family protein [Mangrovibacterium lignilyticum]
MKRYSKLLLALLVLIGFNSCAKERTWKEGILSDEFIYEEAPFPACHASTIAETEDGTMVASWFGGSKEGVADVCIYVSRKENGKWTAPELVADGVMDDGTRLPTWNPVLYQVPGGDLQLYYKTGPYPADWHGWLKTSADGGKTWSEKQMLPVGNIGPVKNKPELVNGVLICPSSSENDGLWRVHMELTPDFGKTWTRTKELNDGVEVIAIQPSILKYADGRLQALCRSKNRAILQTWSEDGGQTWSELTKTSLPQNNSGTDAVTLSDGTQVLVYNHVLPPGDHYKGIRTPLNVAVSKDGENWSAALVLEDTPDSEFSYPAVIQSSDGMIHIVYTWNRVKIKHVVVDPHKLVLTPIVDDEWPKSQE